MKINYDRFKYLFDALRIKLINKAQFEIEWATEQRKQGLGKK